MSSKILLIFPCKSFEASFFEHNLRMLGVDVLTTKSPESIEPPEVTQETIEPYDVIISVAFDLSELDTTGKTVHNLQYPSESCGPGTIYPIDIAKTIGLGPKILDLVTTYTENQLHESWFKYAEVASLITTSTPEVFRDSRYARHAHMLASTYSTCTGAEKTRTIHSELKLMNTLPVVEVEGLRLLDFRGSEDFIYQESCKMQQAAICSNYDGAIIRVKDKVMVVCAARPTVSKLAENPSAISMENPVVINNGYVLLGDSAT